jgi:hypothetical protein
MQKKKYQKKTQVANALSNQYRPSNGRSMEFFHQFSGYPVETNRNIICQYGYPEAPGFADFYAVGRRVGLGTAVINAPIDTCWSDNPVIQDVLKFDKNGEPETFVESEFIKELNRLIGSRKLQFWERLKGLDRKQRFGMYAGMLLVTRDELGRTAREPLDKLVPGQLVKMVPFYEAQLIPIEYNQDIGSPDYGNPVMWQLIENAVNPKPGKQLSMEVHPSRLIIASEGSEDGTIYGVPAMQGCLYAVMDWEKARMSSSEGIKRSNDQRGVLSLQDGSNLPHPESDEAEIMDENVRDWNLGKESLLTVANANVTPFNATFHDPKQVSEMCLQEVAAHTRIPSTVLIGYQTGRLASTEDSLAFASSMMQRRKGSVNEMIYQVLDHLIELGLLPEPDGEIYIEWSDLTEPSTKDKLDVAEKMSMIDERRFKIGQAPFFSDEDYAKETGFVGSRDDQDNDASEDPDGEE